MSTATSLETSSTPVVSAVAGTLATKAILSTWEVSVDAFRYAANEHLFTFYDEFSALIYSLPASQDHGLEKEGVVTS